jgi:hypothetical protein
MISQTCLLPVLRIRFSNGGSYYKTHPDARLDIRARGFWESQRSAFFDVRVCYPNADSYKDLELRQVYKIHENEKKRLYARRVLEAVWAKNV